MAKGPTSGPMEDLMSVAGKRTKCTAKVFSDGRTAALMKATT